LIANKSDNDYLLIRSRELNIKSNLDKYPNNKNADSMISSLANNNQVALSLNYAQSVT